MLQDKTKVDAHLPWLHVALECLSTMSPTNEASPSQTQILIKAINRIICTVAPCANCPCRRIETTLAETPQCPTDPSLPLANNLMTPSDTSVSAYPPSIPSMSLNYYAPNGSRESIPPILSACNDGHSCVMNLPGAQDPDFDWRMIDVETLMSIDPFEFILNARMNEEGGQALM